MKLNINLCYKSGKTAKAILKIELLDKTILNIIAYDEIADFCISNLKKEDTIFVNGEITASTIIVKDIDYI